MQLRNRTCTVIKYVFSTIRTLIQVLSTLLSVASAEWNISRSKRVSTRLRSKITENGLSELYLINVYIEMIVYDEMDHIDNFVKYKNRHLEFVL